MLPDGWRKVPLEQIAEVRTGLAKGKPKTSAAVSLPYLRVANVQDGHIDFQEVKLIAVEPDQVERYSLKSGDILMTEGGDFDKLGRGAVWQAQIEPCLHQNHVFAVRPIARIVDPGYLSALAGSEYGRTYFLSCAKRSTNLASINSSQLRAFPRRNRSTEFTDPAPATSWRWATPVRFGATTGQPGHRRQVPDLCCYVQFGFPIPRPRSLWGIAGPFCSGEPEAGRS